MDEVKKTKLAEMQARTAHEGQMYGDRPYIEHVEDVVAKVYEWGEYGIDHEAALVVAWLHDVVEDCNYPEGNLIRDYGFEVTDAIVLCTDPPGANRKEKKTALYARFEQRSTGLAKIYGTMAKCADRYANQHNTIVTRNVKKAEMYIKEFPTFMRYFGAYSLTFADAQIWNDLFRQYGRMVTMVERVKAEKK